jgi:GH18 family chitinase
MRVVGYYKSDDSDKKIVDAIFKVDIKALTHLNYAFLLPRADGSVFFDKEQNIQEIVDYCHDNNVKAYLSVGGATIGSERVSTVFEKICESDGLIDTFINNTIDVALKYKFDGIDLDWEYPWKEFKEPFTYMVKAFKKVTLSHDMGFTIAINRAVEGEPNFTKLESITDEVIEAVDWLNIMTYDDTDYDNHSSVERAQRCLDYWHNARKVPADKLLIGVAFYAQPSKNPYSILTSKEKGNPFNDFVDEDSYNGIFTVKDKYFLGEKYGGIIIWAINFDLPASNAFSLLNEIDDLSKIGHSEP